MITVTCLAPKYQKMLFLCLHCQTLYVQNLPTTNSQVSVLWNLKLVGGRHETHFQLDRAWEEQKGEERRHRERQNQMTTELEVNQLFSPSQSKISSPLTSVLTSLLPCTHQSLAGWWPYGWWHLQRLQGWFPWQLPDFSPGYAMPAPSNPLLGRGHAHQCSVQSGSCL